MVVHREESQEQGGRGMKERLSGIGSLVLILGLFGMTTGCTLFEDNFVATGRKLFNYYCVDCHGKTGKGDGYNAEFLDPSPSDLTDSEEKHLAELTNKELFETLSRDQIAPEKAFEAILAGVVERYVPSLMPTYKYTLSEAEIWSIVAYIRTLHPNDAPKIVITPEMKRKRPKFARIRNVDLDPDTLLDDKRVEAGKSLYENTYGCEACHSIGGQGGRIGPALDRAGFISNADWLYRWIKAPQAIKPRTKMLAPGLADEDALAIVAYLKTLRAPAN